MNAPYAVWSRPALVDQVVRRRRDGKAEIALHAPGLATSWQALRLEQWLNARPGVTQAEVDTAARRIRIRFDVERCGIADLLQACAQAGTPARPLHRDQLDDGQRREADDALKRLLVAGIFGMQAMMFAFVLYVGVVDAVDATTITLFRWLGLLAATPVVTYAAVPFFRHALADLRARRAGIDVPIALAVVLIYCGSLIATVRGSGETWFDSACMLIFVLLLGRYLQLRARHRHQDLHEAAANEVPLTAVRCTADAQRETVAVVELQPGDRLVVPEGGMVPADGVLASETARIDCSVHTGESRVQTCRHGDPIAAGSLAVDAPLELTVTRTGAHSSLARLQALTHQARAGRQADTPDRAVSWFIGGIITLALGTAGFWWWFDPTRAFDATVAVLVVACPCAFALAAPATLTRAMAVLARHGVLVARPQALRELARVDVAVCDKTGTLTQPEATTTVVMHATIDADHALMLAVALARESSHPLARALARAHPTLHVRAAHAVQIIPGQGITGTVEGRNLRLGRPDASSTMADDGQALWLFEGEQALAAFPVLETARPHAAGMVRALHADGMSVQLSSGDADDRARAMAQHLGIDTWFARQSPDDKYQTITTLQRAGHAVLALGDGGNDTAALAAANVSASLVSATDVARRQADLLLEAGLDGLVLARHMARRVRRTLRQNRAWGLTWNLLAVPFAAMGLIPPWLAAIGMSASSLLVVLNALRMDAPLPKAEPELAPSSLRERTA